LSNCWLEGHASASRSSLQEIQKLCRNYIQALFSQRSLAALTILLSLVLKWNEIINFNTKAALG